jgi:hypothetical protein
MPIPLIGFERIVLVSPLAPDECLHRLRDAVQSERSVSRTDGGVIGKVGGDSFRIRKRPAPMVRNSFQTHLYGTVSAADDGTRVTCRIGLHRFVVIFSVIWICLLWTGGLVAAVATAMEHQTEVTLVVLAFVVGFTLFGVGLVWFGLYLGRDERSFLLEFLQSTIEAHIVGGQESASAVVRTRP